MIRTNIGEFGSHRKESIRILSRWGLYSLPLFMLLRPNIVAAGEKTTVRIGYYENDNFQSGAGENLVKSGYSYEYMSRLQMYTNWEYEYVYGEYGELYDRLVSGEIDILTGLAYKAEREGLIGYPELAMGDTPYYFLKRSDEIDITEDPKTIEGTSIGVLSGAMESITNAYLEQNQIHAAVRLFDDLSERDDALRDGKVDLIIVEGATTGAMEGVEALTQAGAADYYVCTNVQCPALLNELNAAQKELFRANPNLKSELNDRWLRKNAVSSTLSQNEHDWSKNHDSFTVGYFTSYLPYSGNDENGKVTGVIKDVVPELFHCLNLTDIPIKYRGYDTFPEMIEALQNGELDAVFPAFANYWALEQYDLKPTNAVINTYYDLIYQGTYPDLETAKFALRESNAIVQSFKSVEYPQSELLYCGTVQDCLDAVVSGNADVTLLNGLRTDFYIRSKDSYKQLHASQIAAQVPLGFAVSMSDPGTIEILNHGINLMDTDFALTHSYQYEEKHKITISEFLRDNSLFVIGLTTIIAVIIVCLIAHELAENRKSLALQEQQKHELEEAKLAAESASQAKTSFLFNMSHDIRTPMNAIMGFRNLLEKDQEDPEKRTYYLKKIDESSTVLLSIINNVLEMARIEKGTLHIDEMAWSAEQFNDTLYSVFQEMMHQKHIQFTRTIEVQHHYVFCDPAKLREVFLNILSNAYKYTNAGGEVRMELKEIPCSLDGYVLYQTTISDTGMGMSEDFLPHLFEEFAREETSTSNKIEGTGLGMPIVKKLVDFMHGTISVTSEKGVGTTFVVELPHRIAEKKDLTDISGVEIDERLFKGKRILLAEDIEVNAEIAKAILTEVGFIVDVAEDGQICLEQIEHAEPGYYDLILMDIQMPHMNGYQTARAIRQLEDMNKARIPILAMTANAFEEDKREAIKAGMNGHIAKPINIQHLMKELARVLTI